jgi:predicted alpha/beta superfamily hydrolase
LNFDFRSPGKAAGRTRGSFVVHPGCASLTRATCYLLVDAYAAIDPSLWWDDETLSLRAAASLENSAATAPLYLAMAKEQIETPAVFERIVHSIKDAGGAPCTTEMPHLLHSTIYQQLIPQAALQFLLPPPERPAPEFGFVLNCGTSSRK